MWRASVPSGGRFEAAVDRHLAGGGQKLGAVTAPRQRPLGGISRVCQGVLREKKDAGSGRGTGSPAARHQIHYRGNDMSIVHFITHPEVVIDRAIPVPDWPLSPMGRERMRRATLEQPWFRDIRTLFSSAERKARDAAAIIAEYLSLQPAVIDDLGENDRSATGYLPRQEFEAVADEFFARPQQSVRGWERAADAQC